jgi:hypothetical protein
VIRVLYALLIRLHPLAFHERFGPEMLWIFEEAGNALGGGPLLGDATVSLLRQWLIRSTSGNGW